MDIYLTLIPFKTCSCCGVSKEISLFTKSRATKDGLQYKCKDCQKAYDKARYQANPDKVKARHKAWGEAHKDDPSFIVMRSQGRRIPIALKGIKRAASSKELVGGWNEMVTHLESQFEPGMTWDNHGTWHIDHIKPCASFDFSDPEQQHECFHWSNTQPLWAADNIAKG